MIKLPDIPIVKAILNDSVAELTVALNEETGYDKWTINSSLPFEINYPRHMKHIGNYIPKFTLLALAACLGKTNIVEHFCPADSSLLEKLPEADGGALLRASIALCDSKGVAYLLTRREIVESINETNTETLTPVQEAALFGRPDIIELLRKNGAVTSEEDLANYRDANGCTLLILAAINGNYDGVKYLLSIPLIKKQINEQGSYSNNRPLITAFIAALEYPKSTKIAELLRQAGASTKEVQSFETMDPSSCEAGANLLVKYIFFDNEDLVSYLLTLPDIIEIINKKNMNNAPPLVHALQSEGNYIELLLKKGASIQGLIDYKNENNETGLWLAANLNHKKGVEYALSIPEIRERHLNLKNKNGLTPLIAAFFSERDHKYSAMDTISLLLQVGASTDGLVEFRNDKNISVLHQAVISCDIPCIEYLLKHFPQIKNHISTTRSQDVGCTPLVDIIIDSSCPLEVWFKIVKILLENGASWQEALKARFANNDTILALKTLQWDKNIAKYKYILNMPGIKSLVNIANVHGETPLSRAFLEGSIKAIKLLLQEGANPDGINLQSYSSTAASEELIKAAQELNKLVSTVVMKESLDELELQVKGLLKKGASLKQTNSKGNPPFYQAILSKNIKMVQVLVKYYGDLEAESLGELSPFEYVNASLPAGEIRTLILSVLYMHQLKAALKDIQKDETILLEDIFNLNSILESLYQAPVSSERAIQCFEWGKIILENECFNLSEKIKLGVVLLDNIGKENSDYYSDAQLRLAEFYFVRKLDNSYLQKAFLHAYNAGSTSAASDFRKRLTETILGEKLKSLNCDPNNPKELFSLLVACSRFKVDHKKQENSENVMTFQYDVIKSEQSKIVPRSSEIQVIREKKDEYKINRAESSSDSKKRYLEEPINDEEAPKKKAKV